MRSGKKVSVYAKNKGGEVVVKEMHWGLIDASFTGYLSDWGASTTHARLETVAELPAYANAWRRKRRVIFPMESYQRKAILDTDLVRRKGKPQPVDIRRADGKPLGVAGIYDYANLIDGPLLSVAMLTRAPGKRMYAIHDREPVVIDPEDWQAWLDGSDEIDLATPWGDEAFTLTPSAKRGRRAAG